MAITVVTSASAAGNGSTDATTGAIDTTGATLLVAICSAFTVGTSGNISDSKGNTWMALTPQNSGLGEEERMFYVENPIVGSGHTFTNGGEFPSIAVVALAGTLTASALDQQSGAKNSSAASLQPGTLTPAEDNCVIVCGVTVSITGGGSINGGFSELQEVQYTSGVTMGSALAVLIQTTAAASNPTWTYGSSSFIATTQAIFKAAAGGGGGRTTKNTRPIHLGLHAGIGRGVKCA